MEGNYSNFTSKPSIVRYTSTQNTGIEATVLTRHAIGYVIKGEKFIYDADRHIKVSKGDIFYLGLGTHHVENIVDQNSTFEQIVFYYSAEELCRVITSFVTLDSLTFTNKHTCPECRLSNRVSMKAPKLLNNFFTTLSTNIANGYFSHDPLAESIKFAELLYLIVSHEDNCLTNKIFGSIDTTKNSFEQIIYTNIFNDVSIEELAQQCHRSLTSFKKEFRRLFDSPPHQWFLKQRLNYSKLLLISTRKSISEIGSECTFPNTSHYIKLFKKFYGSTPATFRNVCSTSSSNGVNVNN
ncbi:MAG: helix-turn-helix domain-containing protein [Rikenellaceae bacterium]